MQRKDIDVADLKQRLEKELGRVTEELASIGRINPDNPQDWEAVPDKMDILQSDKNEAADKIESYEENTAILKELESEYNDIKLALKKIEDGTYGYCEKDGKPIEKKRLEAYPAARVCLEHAHAK